MLELLGLLLPPFIDIINRNTKNSDLRFLISVVFCILVGIILHMSENAWWFGGQEELTKSILTVFGAAQFSFKVFWDDSNLRNRVTAPN